MNLDFAALLTDAGGTVGLLADFPRFEGICGDDPCSGVGIARVVVSGSVVGAPVPEPASLLLLGTGIAGIAAKVRKRRKQQVE